MPDWHHGAHKRRMWRLLLRAFVLAAVGLFIARLDIFNMDEASQDASTAVFLRQAASWHAISDRLVVGPQKADPIVVVFYDIDRIRQIENSPSEKWTWPLTFSQHAKLLNKLSAYEPRAIFFDIAFYQFRDGEEDFAQAIKRATGAKPGNASCALRSDNERVPNISVFLAEIPGREIETKLCEAGAEGVAVRWDSRPFLYPLQSCDKPEDFQPGGLEECHQKREMAAATLWRDWCGANKDHPSCRARLEPDAHQDALLSLTWGFSSHPDQWRFPEYSCDLEKNSLAGNLWTEIGAALGLVHRELLYSHCLSPLTIPASRILFPNDDDKVALSKLLQDSLILVAVNLPGLRDPLPSPVQRNLPGVFTHAAALDNLIRFPGTNRFEARENYFEEQHEGFLKTLRSFLIIFATLTLVLWCVERIEVRHKTLAELAYASQPGRRQFYKPLVTLLGLIGLCCAVIVLIFAVALWLFWGFHIAPINWAEITVVIIAVALHDILSTARYAILELVFLSKHGRRLGQYFFHTPHKETRHE